MMKTSGNEVIWSPVGGKPGTIVAHAVDMTFLVNKIEFSKNVIHCFEHLPTQWFPLASECIDFGNSVFQNHLMPLLMPQDKVRCKVSRVAYFPANLEVMKPLTEYLSAKKLELAQGLVNYYQKLIGEFEELRRYCPRYIDPKLPIGGTAHRAPELEPERSPIDQAIKARVEAIMILEQVLLVAKDRCTKFVTEFKEKYKAGWKGDEQREALLSYVLFWEDYLSASIELQMHLQPLADAIDQATATLLPELSKKLPPFSIWGSLVIAFKAYGYMPLRTFMDLGCLELVKTLCTDFIEYKARPLPKSLPSGEADVAVLLKQGTESWDDGGAALLEKVNLNFMAASRIFHARLDLGLNEMTVHYIHSKELISQPTTQFALPLTKSLNGVCDLVAKKYGKIELLEPLLMDLLRLLENLLPPCLWDAIEETLQTAILRCLKNNIYELAKQFVALPLEQKKALADGSTAFKVEQLSGLVGKMQTATGGPLLTEESLPLFLLHLAKSEPSLFARTIEHSEALEAAKRHTRRVEDMEIEIKNQYLGIVPSAEVERNLILSMLTNE